MGGGGGGGGTVLKPYTVLSALPLVTSEINLV